jgi:hypothetical protein
MLKKLIAFFEHKKSRTEPIASESATSPADPPPGQAQASDFQRIVAALRGNEMRAAQRMLRERHVRMIREGLPGGDCWVIGEYSFYFGSQRVCSKDVLAGIGDARVFVSRTQFWEFACTELWAAGQLDELRRRLPGVLGSYNAQVYLTWARLLVIDGRGLDAGAYFLFSGLYDDSEREFVERFKRTLARAQPNQILGGMPGPCTTKRARRQFLPRVYEDLATVPCPTWLMRRPGSVSGPASADGKVPKIMKFTTDLVCRDQRFALGIESTSGTYYVSIPVSNSYADYEEFYAITPAQFEQFKASPGLALPFVSECRARLHDDLLLIPPGRLRGTPS